MLLEYEERQRFLHFAVDHNYVRGALGRFGQKGCFIFRSGYGRPEPDELRESGRITRRFWWTIFLVVRTSCHLIHGLPWPELKRDAKYGSRGTTLFRLGRGWGIKDYAPTELSVEVAQRWLARVGLRSY